MSTAYEKLVKLLKELFQTDQADLDFGIYRIMNQRREEINRFLEEDLLSQVKTSFEQFQQVDKKVFDGKIEEAKNAAIEAGYSEEEAEQAPKVKKLKEEKANYSVDIDETENQVYNDLYQFFRRYYDDGDFISQRRYKDGVYAIPYEGEEVKLYWANYDQYYIKTSEYLHDYTFKLPSGKKVHFKLVEADTEKDNRKENNEKKRVFILAEDAIHVENGEVQIGFEFRPDEEKRPQKQMNEITTQTIFDARASIDDPKAKETLAELATFAPTESDKNRTLLAKHLEDYTRRNTQDYFIHKDLGKFLRRELDFYIKNEIMRLDDIEEAGAPRVEQYLSRVKVLRQIAHKTIDFLAQIEDFQKKLWLKKKFVVETNYCITLDRIPEELYPEIAANEAQREEWVRLFAINEIKPTNGNLLEKGNPGYSEPLRVEFLKANPFLVVDTKFFDEIFKAKLINPIENFDEKGDGLLINSENFQALNLINKRYRDQIKCIYIDPPYNTGSDDFIYKDNYQDSSWLSMIEERLFISSSLMRSDAAIFVSIDEVEVNNLKMVLDNLLTYVNLVTIKAKVAGVSGSHFGKSLRNATEYVLIYSKDYNQFFFTENVYDKQELIEFIQEMELSGKSWKYTTVMDVIDEGTYVKSILDGSGNEIKIFKHKNYSFESINKIANDRYSGDKKRAYYENIEKVFRTTNAQSSIRQRVYEETKEIPASLISIKYIPKSGKNAGHDIRLFYKDEGRNLITFLKDVVVIENNAIYKKIRSGNLWSDIQYNNIALEGGVSFSNGKKPLSLISKIVKMVSDSDEIILDYFAGSGTTGHAVINLNREDGGERKYILVEMEKYFDTVLKPRIEKVIYSKDWKDGKPLSRKGSSHAFKYMKLESYEDTLNNLRLKRSEDQNTSLLGNETFKEDYMLHYMLDVEAKESLLDLKNFETPFDYQLNIASSTVGETIPTKVDLVETFNYLIGLWVKNIKRISDCVLVEGSNKQDGRVLVIWRDLRKTDNKKLESLFREWKIVEREDAPEVIYINGDNSLMKLREEGQTWRVKLIEEEFHRRMFED